MTSDWNRGSEWHRWDPHLHTPSTLFNNQFKEDWEGFLLAIENAAPEVDAIGITDYCVLNSYKIFLQHRVNGRARNVRFVFPNLEFRLGIETKAGKGVNVHLLFSPEDPQHVQHIERLLQRLTFRYNRTDYPCLPEWLIQLGRAVDPSRTDEGAALRHGADQFKVQWDQLVDLISQDAWARDNSLIAISAHENDGISGLKHDGSFEALREELKAEPHIIFSGNPGDREFWLGKKTGFDREKIEAMYGSLKPCLHGSDAHAVTDVLKPKQNRNCWIRAQTTFMGLKQALIEPETRVFIGEMPPPGPSASEFIRRVRLDDAPWFGVATLELNDGLVAIVGPKGSGKTALAEVIAHAAGAQITDDSSFLHKASDHLGDAKATLEWGDGSVTDSRLGDTNGSWMRPHVRYLSQQFVDRLCTSRELNGELLEEIESVVFQSIPEEERLGGTNFRELRSVRLEQTYRTRASHLDDIARYTRVVSDEDVNKGRLAGQETAFKASNDKIRTQETELKQLLPKDKQKEVDQMTAIGAIIDRRSRDAQAIDLQRRRLKELETDYSLMTSRLAREFTEFKTRYAACALTPSEWNQLQPHYADAENVPATLKPATERVASAMTAIRDGAKEPVATDPSTWSWKALNEFKDKLEKEIGVEKERAKKHANLMRQLAESKKTRDTLEKDIVHIKGADERRAAALAERRKAYAAVFDAFASEEQVLNELYAPLRASLTEESEADRKLELQVRRRIELDRWVERGEDLLDLRRASFQGYDTLKSLTSAKLMKAWLRGRAQDVSAAMEDFISTHMVELVKARTSAATIEDIAQWLFSTDHVSLEYELRYEGVELANLSPGMKGIVLLILYLAIDKWDTRPLLVDQPEENLDPYSVYQQLVRYFRMARRRRQVIIVTHNPNLVVNADADQVIVAAAERPDPESLPYINYESGGLEDQKTRSHVCRILEGGERAFLDRDRRYALQRDRRKAPRQ